MTPAGTSNELDLQNEWEKNTHTHSRLKYTVYGIQYTHKQSINTEIIPGKVFDRPVGVIIVIILIATPYE